MATRRLVNSPSAGSAKKEKKKGGGFWSKFGKVLSVAAPFIAAPFTGGTSLALGAGLGGLGGAMSGGVKGALLGGGLGAIPGAVGSLGSRATAGAIPGMGGAFNPMSQIPGATGGGVGGMIGKIGSGLGKMKEAGLDPTLLALGGLSLIGGGDEKLKSFADLKGISPEVATMTDPRNALYNALGASARLGQGLQERGPVKLRSSYVPEPPKPIQVPGLSFAFGEGQGRDPALDDPSLLEYNLRNIMKYNPFQNLGSYLNEADPGPGSFGSGSPVERGSLPEGESLPGGMPLPWQRKRQF